MSGLNRRRDLNEKVPLNSEWGFFKVDVHTVHQRLPGAIGKPLALVPGAADRDLTAEFGWVSRLFSIYPCCLQVFCNTNCDNRYRYFEI